MIAIPIIVGYLVMVGITGYIAGRANIDASEGAAPAALFWPIGFPIVLGVLTSQRGEARRRRVLEEQAHQVALAEARRKLELAAITEQIADVNALNGKLR